MKLSQIENRIEALPPVRAIGVRLLKVHQMIYERSGGRIGHRLGPTRALLLRTVGAKTGQPRTNALTYARDGADYVVVASMGGAPRSPGWYHNLRAHPDVEIQIRTRRIPVTAHFVMPGDPDRERLWQLADTNNGGRYGQYQKLTSRPIPVIVLAPR
ncbi:MAG TPA: nitroreductase family deazaflavin-dependent oxidoreductase [Jatrophihabitans sp.]|jgi:deazaflavin-dependent oxidoreductase (nitroreductase family)|nr:nitroreductase family deazaflavin-dependent oxidoreductase [Jatrophihabitans sp.]